MTTYARLFLLVSVLLPISALADAEYDHKENVVRLLSDSGTSGWINIHKKKQIFVGGMAYDSSTQKATGLCGKNPSLGLLVLDGNLQSDKLPPKVTGVSQFNPPNPAGYVHSYVLKGDDAQDLIDMLLEYRQVGFIILSECPDSGQVTSGKLILNFDTRGLERALKRIK